MKITCHQTDPVHGDPVKNFEAIAGLVAAHSSDLHVFPELGLTGYLFDTKADIARRAEPLDGPLFRKLADLAKKHRTAICTGFMEEAQGKFFNSAILLDRTGRLVVHYRKVHLFDREKILFEPGDLGFPVGDLQFESGTVKIGMMICYDWRFPEAARSLALNGAQIVAVPSNIITTTTMRTPILRTRAFENKIYLAFADRVGREDVLIDGEMQELIYQGCSAIIAPNGDILASLDDAEHASISAVIAPEITIKKSINSRNDLFTDRRPEAYS